MTTNDGRLLFFKNPASLLDRAGVIVAGELWRIEISKKDFDCRSLKNAHPRIKSFVVLPKPIETLIDDFIIPMKKSIINWLDFHYLRAFYPHDKTNTIATYSNFLIWRSDCEIGYKDTAENLLTCQQLSRHSKYKLACLYCFEDDIRRMWDTSPCTDCWQNITFETDAMLYYWACRMKNEPPSIEPRAGRSLDGEMIERAGTWSSFVYFWNRIQPNEQIDVFVYFVDRVMEEETRFLMVLLTETQLELAVEQTSVKIIVALAGLPENLEYTLQTWHYIKNTVTVDSFVDMICDIARLDSSLEHLCGLLYDIWQGTPDILRNQVLADHLDIVLDTLYFAGSDDIVCLRCFDELNEFLNFCSTDPTVVSKLKKDIVWSKASIRYCVRYYGNEEKMRTFEEFVKDIEIEPDRGMDLKCQIISSFWNDGYLQGLMNGGNMQSIKNLVREVSSDDTDTSDFKRNLLATCQCILVKGKFRAFEAKQWDEFLLWCMNDDIDQLKKFKQSLPVDDIFALLFSEWIFAVANSYSSPSPTSFLLPRYNFNNFDFDSEFEESDSTEDDRTSEVNDADENITDRDDDNESTNGSDENSNRPEGAQEPINDADSSFGDPFSENESDSDSSISSVSSDNIFESFDTMDNFLMWYFSSKEKIHEFKMRKIQQWDDYSHTRSILDSEDQRLIKIMLEWFFNDDVEQIEVFRASLND
ncbi:hypothetical protein U1Q18_050370 [Sarracenia purpurea var. burkii]